MHEKFMKNKPNEYYAEMFRGGGHQAIEETEWIQPRWWTHQNEEKITKNINNKTPSNMA